MSHYNSLFQTKTKLTPLNVMLELVLNNFEKQISTDSYVVTICWNQFVGREDSNEWSQHRIWSRLKEIYITENCIVTCTPGLWSKHTPIPGSRAPDKVCIFLSTMPAPSPNPMFDH